MVDRSNLNRIKGILSAKLGAGIPKLEDGALIPDNTLGSGKKTKLINGITVYSHDGINWFTDEAMQLPYVENSGNAVNIPETTLTIPGDQNITPTTAIERAAAVSDKAEEHKDTNLAATIAANTSEVTTVDTKPKSPNEGVEVKPKEVSAGMQVETADTGDVKVPDPASKYAKLGDATQDILKGVGDVLGAKLAASDSELTKTVDLLYDATASAVQSLGPVGLAAGAAMQVLGAVGDIAQSFGGGTDLMTTTDLWMDSSFLSWNVGLVNGFGGKKSNSFTVDESTISNVGSSYGGTVADIKDAKSKAGKKYGLFSSSARKRANRAIAKALAKQNIMADISEDAIDRRSIVQSMGELAGLAYSLMLEGGYDQKYTRAAKHGGLLEWNPVITLEWEPQVELNWELPTFKEGGNIDITEELEWIPELQKGGKTRTLELLFEYAKKENPRFILRLSESLKGIDFIDENGELANGSHLLSYSTDNEGNAIVFPQILEMEDGSLHYFEDWKDAYDRAVKNKNTLKMSLKEADLFFAEDPEYHTAYKRGWPDFFKSYKKGGSLGNNDIPEIEETNQKNVIPEGALHKNKHHMEHAEGLTKKGIPVIDEDGELLAEIEHSEIIFTLEVTKKLEEYYDIFYSEEYSNKEKEQAALDAGKLLVYQILENTEDRTGLIESCKKGGSITLKKSTDDLIEEVLDWMPTLMVVEEVIEEVKEEEKPKKKSEKELMKEAIKEVLIELLTK